MITTSVTISAKGEFLRGVHNPGDTYKMALYTDAATLDASTTAYSSTNEVTGTGYTAGGKNLTGYAVSTDGAAAILTFDSPVWNNSSITARGALIYNVTRSGKAIATYDFGANIISTNGPFTATIPPASAASGLVVIA